MTEVIGQSDVYTPIDSGHSGARGPSARRATWLCYSQALSVELLYRFPLVQSLGSVAIGLLGVGMFWLAAGRDLTVQHGYTAGMLLAYFVIASAHGLIQENHLGAGLNMAIRMGGLSAALLRPYPYLLGVFAQVAAHATVRLLMLIPIAIVLFFTFTSLRTLVGPQLSGERLLLYGAAVFLALAAGWLSKTVIGLLAFDMTQTWGPELIFSGVYAALSGISYPADLLPAVLVSVVPWTPVYYMVGFPTLLLLGRLTSEEVLAGLERGSLVTVVTALLVWLMWRRGLKRFEAAYL